MYLYTIGKLSGLIFVFRKATGVFNLLINHARHLSELSEFTVTKTVTLVLIFLVPRIVSPFRPIVESGRILYLVILISA